MGILANKILLLTTLGHFLRLRSDGIDLGVGSLHHAIKILRQCPEVRKVLRNKSQLGVSEFQTISTSS
jgi:hypothetical protein